MTDSVDCAVHREVLSADLDGEADGLELEAALAHEQDCVGCAQWYREVAAMSRSLRLGSAVGGPDLTASILDAAEDAGLLREPTAPPQHRSRLTLWRIVLGLVALGQLCIGMGQLVGIGTHSHGGADAGGHLFNESTAWNLALGIGFAAAAAWPRTARGLTPAAGAFLLVLVGFSVADLTAGTTTAARVASHALVMVGTVLLFLVDRSSRHHPGHGHRAETDDTTLFGRLDDQAEDLVGDVFIDRRHDPHRAA